MPATDSPRPTPARRQDGSAAWRGCAEVTLLRCVARAELDRTEAVRLAAILELPIVWTEFLRLAARHRLLPLCTRHLHRQGSPAVPAAQLQAMREYSIQNARRSLLLAGELRDLLRVFDAAGIPALAHKGPALAQLLYGSVALRDMLDLDIVVQRADAQRARACLCERGYRPAHASDVGWDVEELRSDSNIPLVSDDNGTLVELHWTPEASLTEQAVAELWTRAGTVSLAGTQVPVFSDHDQLVLLCLHGCRHMWERLEWVADVAELLRRGGFDWDRVMRIAGTLHGRRALFVGLVLSHELLGAPVPPDLVCRACGDRPTRELVEASCRQLFGDVPVLAHQLGWPFHRFQLCAKDGLRDRIRYVQQRTLAPSREDRAAFHLPVALSGLYAATRPLRLAAAYASRLRRGSAPPRSGGE